MAMQFSNIRNMLIVKVERKLMALNKNIIADKYTIHNITILMQSFFFSCFISNDIIRITVISFLGGKETKRQFVFVRCQTAAIRSYSSRIRNCIMYIDQGVVQY